MQIILCHGHSWLPFSWRKTQSCLEGTVYVIQLHISQKFGFQIYGSGLPPVFGTFLPRAQSTSLHKTNLRGADPALKSIIEAQPQHCWAADTQLGATRQVVPDATGLQHISYHGQWSPLSHVAACSKQEGTTEVTASLKMLHKMGQ